MNLLIVYLYVIFVGFVTAAPTNPCPNVFQYRRNEYNEVYGILTFKNDFSGNYRLELKMCAPVLTNEDIRVHRITSFEDAQTGSDIMFDVHFPIISEVPEIDEIMFNGQRYCSFPHSLSMGASALTCFSAYNEFSVGVQRRGPQRHQQYPNREFGTDIYRDYINTNNDAWSDFNRPNEIDFTFTTPNPITEITRRTHPPPTFTRPNPVTEIPRTTNSPTTNIDNNQCGVSQHTQTRIAHGTLTTEGQYPWLVAMFHLLDNGRYQYACAANLVTPNHVISAAHCVRHRKKPENLAYEVITLVLGRHNIKTWATDSEVRGVKEVFIHPEYKKLSDADISIILMHKSVQYTSKIKPICLWQDITDNLVGQQGTVVGWGRDEFFNDNVPEPRQISMPVVSEDDCLQSDERFKELISNRTFCAGSRDGSGVCQGDSGSGFIMKHGGRWNLRGIVSSSLVDPSTLSCDVNNYMVFVDVVRFKRWIQRIISVKL